MSDFQFTTGQRMQDIQNLEKIIPRADILKLAEFFQRGAVLDFHDKQRLIDIIEDDREHDGTQDIATLMKNASRSADRASKKMHHLKKHQQNGIQRKGSTVSKLSERSVSQAD